MKEITRNHARHTTSIPLKFRMEGSLHQFPMKDLAEGGICFVSNHSIPIGKILNLFIETCKPKFNGLVTVEWCKKQNVNYLIGVSFRKGSQENLINRLVEQVFYIEDYCAQVGSSRNINISREQAVNKWLKYN